MHDRGGGVCHAHPPGRYYEIQSMSGRYASYWNAFLLESAELLPPANEVAG